jgi:cobalt-zinc-cadmium efflux system outer membrane protein
MRSWMLCLGALFFSQASAQPLSLQDVLRSVERSYPLLNAERQKLAKAEAEALSARGAFDTKLKAKTDPATISKKENYGRSEISVEQPTMLYGLDIFAGWSLGAGVFPDYYGEYVTAPAGEFFLGVGVPVLRGGAIDEDRANLQQSTLEITAADAEVTRKLLLYQLAAANKYWDWVAAGALLEIEQRLLQLAEARDAGIKSRVDQGLIPEIEAVDNDRLVLSRKAKVLDAQLKMQQAALGLSLYWRDNNGRPLVPTASQLPPWPSIPRANPDALPQMISTALSQRPELDVVDAKRSQADVSLDLAQNQLLPSLALTVAASQEVAGASSIDFGVRFELPAQQRKARGSVAKAEAEQNRLDEELTYYTDLITSEVQLAFAALKTIAEQVSLQQASLDGALRLADGERKRFELGTSTILIVNLREVSAAEAEASLVEAKRRYFVASAMLEAAMGSF